MPSTQTGFELKSGSRWIAVMALVGVTVGTLSAILPISQLLIIPVALGLAAVLAMPDSKKAPVGTLWIFTCVAFASYFLWPSYIFVRIPGLPWLSLARIIMFITIIIGVFVLSQSAESRRRLGEGFSKNWLFAIAFWGVLGLQAISLAFAGPNLSDALTKFLNYQIFWTFPLLAAIVTLRQERGLWILAGIFVGVTIIEVFLAGYEWKIQGIFWLHWLPPGLSADSEYLQRVFAAKIRADRYRAQGTFTLQLTLAEFLAFAFPFALTYVFYAKNFLLKMAGVIATVLVPFGLYFAEARSGYVAVTVILFSFFGMISIRKWLKDKRGLLGPMMVALYPVVLLTGAAVILSSGRISTMLFGGGQHQASTDARWLQWNAAIPKIISHPFGHGVGTAAETLGYTNLGGVLTIDSYAISVLLEIGILGFVLYVAAMVWGVYKGFMLFVNGKTEVSVLGGAISCAILGFMFIKLVLSQVDNHIMLYVAFGMLIAIDMLERRSAVTTSGSGKTLPAKSIVQPSRLLQRMRFGSGTLGKNRQSGQS